METRGPRGRGPRRRLVSAAPRPRGAAEAGAEGSHRGRGHGDPEDGPPAVGEFVEADDGVDDQAEQEEKEGERGGRNGVAPELVAEDEEDERDQCNAWVNDAADGKEEEGCCEK